MSKQPTKNKRLLLTQEIIDGLDYEDPGALDLLRSGSPLAGDIPKCAVFQELYKPCLVTLSQLTRKSEKWNQAIFAACHSSGDAEVDRQVHHETREGQAWLGSWPNCSGSQRECGVTKISPGSAQQNKHDRRLLHLRSK